MTTSKPPTTPDPSQKAQQPDSSLAHHPAAPRQPLLKQLRPGTKGQRVPMARPRVAARQRGSR
jgi:hypothetical protein